MPLTPQQKSRRNYGTYRASDYGQDEVDMMRKFRMQLDDAKKYFLQVRKPRLDRAYKLYMADNSDRAQEIKSWQSNIFVPYIHSVVETMMPRVIDSRPEFEVKGRTEEDQRKAPKLRQLTDYNWEIAEADSTLEEAVRASLIYGTGFLQTYWKKDERTVDRLKTQDINAEEYEYEEEKIIKYDAPYVDWVDNYSLWYDWHNTKRDSKQYWFKRLVLTGNEIRRRYPMSDEERLNKAFNSGSKDLTDYANVRQEVKSNHEDVFKGAERLSYRQDDYNRAGSFNSAVDFTRERYKQQADPDLQMHEVFEWWRPMQDKYAVMVNEVPILKGGEIPNPYDHKESPFIEIPYLQPPNEFEGWGIPHILENPQNMLNMIKNQRLDAVTLNIHKMWIVNPMANIDKSQLVTRPFGIIYSQDPDGVRPVEFSDVKSSAYKEEELLKGDMRNASGVSDFSMGTASQGATSATEVKHLRESTLERVSMFINHLGSGLADVMRHWLDMYRQMGSREMEIRVTGDSGKEKFPLIEQDDLEGEFDYAAHVLPSIAGQNDVNKKQGMDLFQLLIKMPFIDPKKLTSKLLSYWDWNLDSLTAGDSENPQGMPSKSPKKGGAMSAVGAKSPQGLPPKLKQMMGAAPAGGGGAGGPGPQVSSDDSEDMDDLIMEMLGTPNNDSSNKQKKKDILQEGAKQLLQQNPDQFAGETQNPRGHNNSGKVNTNGFNMQHTNEESKLSQKTNNIQR